MTDLSILCQIIANTFSVSLNSDVFVTNVLETHYNGFIIRHHHHHHHQNLRIQRVTKCMHKTRRALGIERIYLRQRSSGGSVNKTILKPQLSLAARR